VMYIAVIALLLFVNSPEGHALACKAAGDWGIYTCEVPVPKSAFEKAEEEIQKYGGASAVRAWIASEQAWDLVYSEGDFTTSLKIVDKYLVPTEVKQAAEMLAYVCRVINHGHDNIC
jgi:hypothetical protein